MRGSSLTFRSLRAIIKFIFDLILALTLSLRHRLLGIALILRFRATQRLNRKWITCPGVPSCPGAPGSENPAINPNICEEFSQQSLPENRKLCNSFFYELERYNRKFRYQTFPRKDSKYPRTYFLGFLKQCQCSIDQRESAFNRFKIVKIKVLNILIGWIVDKLIEDIAGFPGLPLKFDI